MNIRCFVLAVVGTASIFSVSGSAIAQSAMGECGFESHTDDGTSEGTMFLLDGVEFDESALPMPLQQALFDARLNFYKEQLKIIDSAILEIEIERQAASAGKPVATLKREFFNVAPPSDAVIESFYNANRAQIPYPLDQVRDQIRQMLAQQQVQQKQQSVLENVKQDYQFQLALAKPVAPIAEIDTDGFPSKGPANAKLTLIEFADYQCPHCQRAAGALNSIRERFADDLRIVFMDFPVNRSGISRVVALGAACADRQDQFWAYHDLAFERQSSLSHESPARLAADIGLDEEAFATCMKSNFPLERVARSENEASRLGLSGTPTFFLDGRRLHLHDLEADLIEEIGNALNGKDKS